MYCQGRERDKPLREKRPMWLRSGRDGSEEQVSRWDQTAPCALVSHSPIAF